MNKLCSYKSIISIFLIVLNFNKNIYVTSFELNLCSGDISDSEKDVLNASNNQYYYSTKNTQACQCEHPLNCVRKCCKTGFYLGPRKYCYSELNQNVNHSKPFEVSLFTNTTPAKNQVFPHNFIVGVVNCSSIFRLNSSNPNDEYFLQENGDLWVSTYEKFFKNDRYCVDELDGFTMFLCFEDEDFPDDTKSSPDQKLGRRVNVAGMIISMPFLLATFLVYAALPDRNLHQKALMFYVISLLIAYVTLVTIQLSQSQFDLVTCKLLGFSTVFFFMVSFFWMNVICIDIWFTFSGSRGFGSRRASERRRLLYYCGYSWGMSFLQVLIIVLINEYGNEKASYYPGVAVSKCFLSDGLPLLLYFYGQIAIILAVNIFLFSMTAYKIRKVKKETSMLKQTDSKRHSYEKDKQKFNLYLKLLFAMGVNWSMEIISWAVNWKMGDNIPHYVWYLTDFCNAIYGVFIFFIFVFKKKIWKQLQKRYYTVIGRPHLAHSLTTTQTTRASNYSSGNYSTADTAFNADNRTTLTDIRSSYNNANGIPGEERPLNGR